jgi:hypothetical protein
MLLFYGRYIIPGTAAELRAILTLSVQCSSFSLMD